MDSFDHFLDRIGRHELLEPKEEIELARQVQAWLAIRDKPRLGKNQKRICVLGRRAYDRMFTANLRLVVFSAKKFIRAAKHMTIDDLVQEGCFGLSRSIEKFDPERGYKFSTYAFWWIRQSIMRAMEIQDRTIRLPVTAVQLLTKLRKWAGEFEAINGRMPTHAECIEHLEVSPDFYRSYMMHASGCASLDANATTEYGSDPLITLLADDAPSLMIEIEAEDLRHQLAEAIRALEPQEYELLDKRYGMSTGQTVSRRELGRRAGISHETIRTREEAILNKLRSTAALAQAA